MMAKKRKKRRGKLRAALMAVSIVLGLVLAALLGGTVYAEYLLNKVNYVPGTLDELLALEQLEELLNAETEPYDEDFKGPDLDEEDVHLENAQSLIGGKGSGITNIMLVGADYQSGKNARSDVMILCTFNKAQKTITMTSFLRDTYVQIPGNNKNRLNASYFLGGMDLLEKTLRQNFGIHLDGMVEIDFSHFQELIDLLGGVEIELNAKEADFIVEKTGTKVKVGTNLLTGQQALWYSRFRGDASGDFGRTSRQREVLSIVLNEYKNSKLTTLLALMDDILPMVTTNMSKTEVLGYVLEFFPMLSGSELITQRIPVEGGYEQARINGNAVIVPDLQVNIDALTESLLGKTEGVG